MQSPWPRIPDGLDVDRYRDDGSRIFFIVGLAFMGRRQCRRAGNGIELRLGGNRRKIFVTRGGRAGTLGRRVAGLHRRSADLHQLKPC